MKIFKNVFRISLLEELQYKTAFISGVMCQFAFGFMYIMLYQAFFKAGIPQDFNVQQMATYIWLGQAFFAMFCFLDNCKNNISRPIMNGDVGYQLVKPINLYKYWFMQVFSKSFCAMLVRSIFIFVIGFMLPTSFRLGLPVSLPAFLMFLVALFFGFVLMTALKMICYILTLYTLDARGVFTIVGAIFSLLAGGVIPLPLMPNTIQNILAFTPFRYVSDLAYRIYIGNINLTTAIGFIVVQVVWIVALIAIGYFVLNKKSKKLIVQGG